LGPSATRRRSIASAGGAATCADVRAIVLPAARHVLLKDVESTDTGYLRYAFDNSADAVVVLLGKDAPWPEGLPYADACAARMRQRGGDGAVALATELPNERGTRVVGVRQGASTFASLTHAGLALHQALDGVGGRNVLVYGGGLVNQDAKDAFRDAFVAAAYANADVLPSFAKPAAAKAPLVVTFVGLGTCQAKMKRSEETAIASQLCRRLAHLPPNFLSPGALRGALRAVAEDCGATYDELDFDALQEAGAGAFVSVAQASPRRDCAMVRLTFKPAGATLRPVVLVGKGVTFDTGGVNVKGAAGMRGMKRDMAGAASVLGAFVALTRLAPTAPHLANRPVEAWFAVTDNLLGPESSRPDDVVTAVCGTTIEVVHTDAEGRMVLADTLALASGKAPKPAFRDAVEPPALLVDVATLTGSAIGAVSNSYGAVFTNRGDHRVFNAIVDAGNESGERLWPCPPVDEGSGFLKALESDVADVLQCRVASEADHIYAAAFLQKFVSDKVPWLHLDVAAASNDGGLAHVRAGGATGFGVRAVLALVLDHWQALAALDDAARNDDARDAAASSL